MKKYKEILSIALVGCMLMTGCAVKEKNAEVSSNRIIKNKEIRKLDPSRRISIIKPITKIIVGKNFLIDKLEQVIDIDANDPGSKSQLAVAYTKSNLVWDEIDQKRDINVAIIDTGIDYNHPDLKNRVKVDLGYDFVNDDPDPMDDNGHGTHVAGIIAAEKDNNEGIVGIVGDLDVNIIPIKALDKDGSGDIGVIAQAIEYAVDKGAHIINLSLGGPQENEEIKEAIEYAMDKGVFVIAAAGNDSRNCDRYVPAGLDGVYTVAASNLINKKANFSNYGKSVDIAAPGVKILSTVPNGGYEAWDGTSMATPVVTGVVAMLMTENPDIDINEIKDILSKSSKDIMQSGIDPFTGTGLIDAQRAFELLTGNELGEVEGNGELNSIIKNRKIFIINKTKK
ncbi:S8 family peptidase [Anaeromicrobium sediminis]|uniref:Peptidase S8/S53 domain-containing protein n=1 Tax=Anaeromicrobium sediminis TaxID=1478221 RepID=A0A267MBD4_9FIRM|nr:S8 family peptidase [Anaeromicrobium sediminis]PAB56894.1 hypothetical protein CCE28_19975 [Anaeromicrobium sediminis]